MGLPPALHEDALPYQAIAPVTLEAVRVALPALVADVRSNAAFHARLLAYAHQQMMAMTRAAVCHRYPPVVRPVSIPWMPFAMNSARGVREAARPCGRAEDNKPLVFRLYLFVPGPRLLVVSSGSAVSEST